MASFLRGNSLGIFVFFFAGRRSTLRIHLQDFSAPWQHQSSPSLLKIPMKSYESTVRDEAKRKVCVEFLQISGIVTPPKCSVVCGELLISASKRVYQIVLYALSLFERVLWPKDQRLAPP